MGLERTTRPTDHTLKTVLTFTITRVEWNSQRNDSRARPRLPAKGSDSASVQVRLASPSRAFLDASVSRRRLALTVVSTYHMLHSCNSASATHRLLRLCSKSVTHHANQNQNKMGQCPRLQRPPRNGRRVRQDRTSQKAGSPQQSRRRVLRHT